MPSPEQGAPTGRPVPPVPPTGPPATGSTAPTDSGQNTATIDPPPADTVAGLDSATGFDTANDSEASIPLPIWFLAGAAALAASNPRTRALLSRGGSTRATLGSSRLVLIHDETSPTSYRFAMTVPHGGHTEINPDGTATVYDRDGNAVQQVARPWAFDATGQAQETWYTVDDNGDLVQHVEPAADARYPILADPPGDGAPPSNPVHLKPQPGDPGFIGPVTPEQQQQARAEQAKETPPANDGLSDLLTAGITDQTPATEPETSPTQGAEPAPGQQLGYDDWVANNYLGQDVGVVNVRNGTDGQPEYYRSNPDGNEIIATTAHTAPNGGVIYGFEDGTVIATDIGDGVSALVEVHPDETIRVKQADGLSYDIKPDGNVSLVRIPNNSDTRGALFSAAMEGARGLLEAGGLTAQPGRHALNPGEAAAAARWLRILGKGAGPAGTIASVGAGGIDLANGAPVPETVGSTAGGLAGATLGAAAGAGVGTFAGVATAAAIGAGAGSVVPVVGTAIGAAVGAGIGAWVGSSYGRNIGEGARSAWIKLFE
ncbi:hypothetical protein [Gordonia sp. NPDC058843]|uniref:hypothetical protein n=1 Tax=Gordonia sp. NPDC058843 TaxID=3346648 RepID=UPI0036D07EC7